ncbi:ATP-dependent DNA helicase RecQ [Rodentibacter caecimuris]|uniref:ATP-dependent DNA helicase RecQ n=1 Tax=Rodentibacter caecimuris TaxID=1796644 RepID=A0A9X8YY58_9PAST|nr:MULTISPECIES: DNA helicase RecQ [Pasteurellaceae]AOF52987.1 ATP-dependent DNA helicase RecQ [Pasteurellaceae bacterium NI1060]OOF71446.1 ATP-dependent DNA helicase RecQ [Rodentibacter heylii]OOF76234.1 ATP-dependent DNA helicase RecQ [Rodentibacter heylii]OOF77117.1 ATP-dependent DNA helicase RecQ [Rodentibacter heylii]TGY50172.1 DNA helicase RecQ [Pasteurella caecimuris]
MSTPSLSPKTVEKPTALSVLNSVFGYQSFRKGQEEVINAALNGQDTLVVMATGNGKSLCYQIPALCFDGLTLVISPLISLMKDQVDQLQANGIEAAFLNSSQTLEQQQLVQNKLISGNLKLLYISPEKVMTNSFFQLISYCQVSFIAIDEAHCISQWGHDFRPEYTQLGGLKSSFPNAPIMALTATADYTTRQDILTHLKLHNPYKYVGSFDRPNIRYTLEEKFKPTEQLTRFVLAQKGKSGIVYCNSRNKVERIAESLRNKGISAAAYHAGMETAQRERVQQDFQRDNVQVVVATIAFGMGINKSNVRFVAHFDLPRSIESYYQETGRAGRDDLPAEAVLFYEAADYAWLQKILLEKPETPQRQIEQHKLEAIGEFAESQTCRRLVLLNYFGEHRQTPCNNCDICLDPPKKYDGLVDAQKVMSAIYRVGQCFGAQYVIGVLRGMQNQKILERQHDKLSVYGIGKDKSKEHWQSVIRQLIHLGFIQQVIGEFNTTLQLTENAKPVLKGEVPLELAMPRISAISKMAHNPQRNAVLNYDKDLFARLRFLRKQIADKENIPPYIVFNDATLQEMAQYMPTSNIEMLQINGVGTIKLERFAQPFIMLIKEHKAILAKA